ncbi:uncharacterized protein LOC119746122 [Patiria miniata]|uniref:Spc7 kinetochore protein domain-containing protein n=1 Tax=Patiria miniata TaxID=46514 RepID=A0A914BSA3_PATMI|nr:uncharacterized protein LOC119746122 [Patiria miniata]
MSGIRFALEGENLGVGSRPRPKKRRSSILKSPSRNALQDLDPNADERDTTNAKKKRRSSRRVSFANTYQVQEFLTANQLKLLEDTNVERDSTQLFSPEKVDEATAHTSSVQDATASQSFQPDISVGPGHCIRGLETLLSGPIKNQSHQDAVVNEPMIPHAYSQPREGAVQLPMIDETCELAVETKVESSTRERSDANDLESDEVQDWPGMTATHDSLGVGLVGPRYHCSLPVTDSFSSSCHSSSFISSMSHSELHDGPDVDLEDTANFELTLCREKFIAGLKDPEYTYDQPVTTEPSIQKTDGSSFLKSFMSAAPGEDSFNKPVQKKDANSFLKSFMSTASGEDSFNEPVSKKDGSSFLKSFMSTAPGGDSFNQPAHSTFPAYTDGDRYQDREAKLDSKGFLKSLTGSGNPAQSFPDADSSANNESKVSEKKDGKSFSQSLYGNNGQLSQATSVPDETCIFGQDDVAAEMDLTACLSLKETDGQCKKKTDGSAFLKSLAKSNPSDDFGPTGHSRIPNKVNEYPPDEQKTQVFGRDDDVNSGMDLTTCVGGMLQAKLESGISVKHSDMTVRFGEDDVGGMEFTQCVGGLQDQQQQPSSQKRSRAVRPLADITQTFHGQIDGGEMDLTTCANPHVVDSSHHPGPEANVGQTRIFHYDDTTAAMEMTTCLNYQGNVTKSVIGSISSITSDQDAAGDKTRVFHCDDNMAAMEMTECLDEKTTFTELGTSLSQREVAQQENIKPFATDHTIRNETTYMYVDGPSREVQIKHDDKLLEKSIVAEPAGSDKTQIFKAEDVGCMEFTTCIGGLVVEPKSSSEAVKRMSGVASSTLPLVQPEDLTRNFTSDDTGRMEMTACLGGVLTDASKMTDTEMVSTKHVDKTHIFTADETAHMELTTCVGSLKPLPSMPSIQPEDRTRNFTSDDTGRMEMTTCIGGMVMDSSQMVDTQLRQIEQVDKTHVFSADETAQMELTTCVGSLKPFPSLVSSSRRAQRTNSQDGTAEMEMTSKMEMTACIGGIFPKMSADSCRAETTRQLGDHTTIFSSNDTASMEMTKCIGGLQLPTFAARPQSNNLGEHTRVFTTDEATRMEMTACVGGLLSKESPEEASAAADSTDNGLPDRSLTCRMNIKLSPRDTDLVISSTSQQHYPQDQTCIYSSDNTASMEMTTCIGGLTEKSTLQCPDDHLSQTMCRQLSNQTRIFTSDNTASMEMTTCLGGIDEKAKPQSPGKCQVSQTTARLPTDHTRIFTSDNTASMEMTTCLGGINDKSMPQSANELHLFQTMARLPSDQTRIFAHDVTGKMELTTCIGGIDSRSVMQHPPEDSAVPQADSTRHFTSEETGNMELTKCIYVVDEKEMGASLGVVSPGKKSSFGSSYCQDTEGVPPLEQAVGHQDKISQQIKDEREAMEVSSYNQIQAPLENLDSSSSAKEPQLTKRSSDTFTIEPSSQTGAPTEPSTRRSDTYTLEKPTSSSTIVENPTADTIQQMDDPTSATDNQDNPAEGGIPAMGDLNRWGSLDSNDGIENEQPVWVENTEDFAQLSAEAGVARLMMMEAMKDQTDSKNAFDLPSFAQDRAQDAAAPSLMPSSIEEHHASKAEESVPPSILNLPADVSSTQPPSGPVSMRDFLEFVTISMPKGRRSVLPCLPQAASPQTLSDFMEDHFIIKPKKELYEWAVSHLSSSIEKMQEAVNEQEQQMSECNPDIVTEVQCASPDEAARLHGHIESLHKACTKMSKGSFQEWRLKMVSKTHQSFKQTEAEMNDILSMLSSCLDTADKNMEELQTFKEGLDNTLTRLQSIKPPSQEEVKEFIDRQKQLEEKRRQVEEIRMSKDALESESLRLKEEMKQCKEELAEAREKEMLLSNQTTSDEALQEAMIQLEDLHCLQQWRWRQHSENELIFTFLEDSLVLTVKLGKELDNGGGVKEREIASLHMESLLTDDASISAQLAHNLVKASVDVDALQSRYPTTAALKMLLQEVSEAVCQADGIADEIDRISYRHVVTLDETNLIVEFSDLDAFVKFWVTFHLVPGKYPFSVISADFRHKIGTLNEQDVQAVVSEVKPGWTYLTRLVHRIDKLIKQHIPSDQTTF